MRRCGHHNEPGILAVSSTTTINCRHHAPQRSGDLRFVVVFGLWCWQHGVPLASQKENQMARRRRSHSRRSTAARRAASRRRRDSHGRFKNPAGFYGYPYPNPYDRAGRHYSRAARVRAGRKGGKAAHRRRRRNPASAPWMMPWGMAPLPNPRRRSHSRRAKSARRAAAHRRRDTRGRFKNPIGPRFPRFFHNPAYGYDNPRRHSRSRRRSAAARHRRRDRYGRFV